MGYTKNILHTTLSAITFSIRLSLHGYMHGGSCWTVKQNTDQSMAMKDHIHLQPYMTTSATLHAQVCGCIHNQDEQRHAQSLAGARASLAKIPQCREPPARACSKAGQCQPRQNSETQRCKP